MKRIVPIFSISIALIGHRVDADTSNWPKLVKGGDIARCTQALQVAKGVFQSDAFYLYAPPILPADLGSAIVLEPAGLDISGGDALKADQTAFSKMPIDTGAPRSIYWQKEANYGMRLVVSEYSRGWRGDTYSLFSIKKEITPDQFLEKYREDQRAQSLPRSLKAGAHR